MGSPIVTLLFSLLVLSIPLLAYSQCSYTSPNTGVAYDFSDLDLTVENNNGVGYWFHSQSASPNCSNAVSGPWFLNFCSALNSSNSSTFSQTCVSTVGTSDVTVCQYGKNSAGILEGSTFGDLTNITSIQNAPSWATNQTEGFAINYFKGSTASCGTKTRNTTVYLFCDPSTVGSFDCIYENKAVAACSYIIIFRSKYACAAGGGFDGGWVFVIIVVCAIPLYLIIGALWKFRTGARGIELIPNIEFWRETPHYFKDGCRFLFYKITCRKDDYTTF